MAEITHYPSSSRGDIEIATMNYRHLENATKREEAANPTGALALALRAELDRRDIAYAASQAAEG